MKLLQRLCVIVLVCALLVAVLPVSQGSAKEAVWPKKKVQGATVIRLSKARGIIPQNLKVSPGHTVIWLNESESLIEIQFTGKQVVMACDGPVNFIVDVDGTFVSNKIPMGAVASLCFIQKGEYDYRVQCLSKPAQKEFKGKLIVE